MKKDRKKEKVKVSESEKLKIKKERKEKERKDRKKRKKVMFEPPQSVLGPPGAPQSALEASESVLDRMLFSFSPFLSPSSNGFPETALEAPEK